MKTIDTLKRLCKPILQRQDKKSDCPSKNFIRERIHEDTDDKKQIVVERVIPEFIPNTIFANNFIVNFLILTYLLVYGLSLSTLLKCLILYKIFCLGLSILTFYVLPKYNKSIE